MGITTEWLRFGKDNEYSGYYAVPDRTNGERLPAVVIIQEIWGVDEHIQDVTKRYAAAGYAAIAPELFAQNGQYRTGLEPHQVKALRDLMDAMPPGEWRNQEARDRMLADRPEEERKQIELTQKALFSGHPMDYYLQVLQAAGEYLQQQSPHAAGSKLAAVGFCLGGALVGKWACAGTALSAGVIYYGNAPDADELQSLGCPLLGFYGEQDTRLVEQIPAFEETTKKLGKSYEYVIYPNAPHAFFNDSRPSYRPAASRDAFAKTLAFLNGHLS